MATAPLTRPGYRPRAWRLGTDQAQIYEIPGLLTRPECLEAIEVIDSHVVPSTTLIGRGPHRTSETCVFSLTAARELTQRLDRRFADLVGVEPERSDPLQGQRYGPGAVFRAHTDWFPPDHPEAARHLAAGGQRTWTVMVYLNAVPAGGTTLFHRIGRRYDPIPGFALAWNNLLADGTPNPHTLHAGMPVDEGCKYILTKWFREFVPPPPPAPEDVP
ncbi:MAG: 2OG-Fe(II) oxygenase [Synechococcaceae cyanobacterium]|nr:2OG-Fe(II) oxygenase [Synechococcaceae cyanobacterium]